ncbi:hypothetical protein L211DRAFT_817495 [Terfezia boudieri ATCC MYA-4762]|uniref:Uncharacterized protein n=1 Tax=Terfezia boudieri ATCC MYA-4762 TaxID=1051890 RepID=A0A3N4M294_9PEZI|nr:hypothetical protein L211DRAFT_817495 [Terfezia boudieri ATCC MYA-4762]
MNLQPIQELQTKTDRRGITKLKPVRLDHLHGVRRRDTEKDYQRLDLAQEAFMIYAAHEAENKGVMMANMTLFAPGGVPVILMERFEGLTKAVDCSIEKDGSIGLTLLDQKGFEYAKKAWDWINAADNDEFIMVTDHEGCAPGNERKAYHVYNIEYDTKNLVVKLFATHAPWEEIAGNYDLKFATYQGGGKVPGSSRAQAATEKFQARGIFDKFTDWVSNKVDKTKEKLNGLKDKFGDSFDSIVKELGEVGDKTIDEAYTWDINKGSPGQRVNIYTDILNPNDPRQILDCTDCYTKGQVKFVGHLRVENFVAREAWFSIAPENIEVNVKLNLKLKATEGEPLAKSLDIFSVPFAGITIPSIFNLGPKVEYEVSLTTDIKNDLDISFGSRATIPNGALMKATIPDFDKSEVSGWDDSKMESLPFEINSGSVDAEFKFSASPVIGVQIYAIGIVSYEAALKVHMPRVKTKFTSFEDPAGACEKSDTAETKGVRSNTEAAFALDFVVGEDKIVETKPPFFEKTLWEHKLPATEGCTPVGERRVPKTPPSPTPKNPKAPAEVTPPGDVQKVNQGLLKLLQMVAGKAKKPFRQKTQGSSQ